MQAVNQLQEYFPTDWSGFTDKNHLKAIYQLPEPQKALDRIIRLNTINHGEDLQSTLRRYTVKTFETEDDFRWMLQGETEKNLPLVAAYINGNAVTVTSQTGISNTTFELEFSEPYFGSPARIVGEYNEVYPINIKSGPTASGNNYLYICELGGGDPNLFIPYDQLVAGKRFSLDFNIVETSMSVRGGSVSYTSPFSMRNMFSMLRMEDTRPGDMIERPVAWAWEVVENGKTIQKKLWSEYADWEFEQQFNQRVNNFLAYAKTNRTATGTYMQKGDSGNVIVEGAGLRQQMSPSHNFTYNTFDVNWLTDCVMQLSVGNIPQSERNMLLRSGEWGIKQFHEKLQDYASLWVPANDATRIVMDSKTKQMTFQGQFTKFIGPMGITLSVEHDPAHDNTARNKIMHPSGKGVAESYAYDIFNMGSNREQPNIQLCYKKGQEIIYKIMPGLRSPWTLGTSKNGPELMAMRTDGYMITRATTLGAVIYNPLLTARLEPDILQP